MLRSLVGKVARRTPILRRFVGGHDEKAAAPAGAGFGQAEPRAATPPPAARPAEKPTEKPTAKPAAAPVAAQPAEKPAAAPVAAQPAAAPVAAPAEPAAPAAAAEPADKPAAGKGKKAGAKKAGGKKAAAAPAVEEAPAPEAASEKHTEGGRDAAEVERLRQEAEQRKAEIRARKEAEAAQAQAAAPAPSAAGGIAALIAQTGGKVDDVGAATGVRATSGLQWVPEDTDVHLAEDGEEYWGAIDNDSSRAYARGDTLIIDQWECINCGTCVENTEHVFVLPLDAKAVVISQEGPMDLIQDAIDACPVTCIHWTDTPDQFEQINDAEGNPLG